MMLQATVKPVLKTTYLERPLALQDHFGLAENFTLPVFEPLRKNHLCYKTTFIWHNGWSYNTCFTAYHDQTSAKSSDIKVIVSMFPIGKQYLYYNIKDIEFMDEFAALRGGPK